MTCLVTGTGRCGTTWAAETLRSAGIPARQQSYRHEHALGMSEWGWDGFAAEVSFEAAPCVQQFREDGSTVVLLWRPCLEVAGSWLSLGVFQPEWERPYVMFYSSIQRFAPWVLEAPTPKAMAVEFWLAWNQLIEPHCHSVVQAFNGADLLQAVGAPSVDPSVPPRNVGTEHPTFREKVIIEPEDLGADLWSRVSRYIPGM